MHPLMMTALAREVERERLRDPLHGKPALTNHTHGDEGALAASGFARRLLAGIGLRSRLS